MGGTSSYVFPYLGDRGSTFDPNIIRDFHWLLPGPGGSYNDCWSDRSFFEISLVGFGRPHINVECCWIRLQDMYFWGEWPDYYGVFDYSWQYISESSAVEAPSKISNCQIVADTNYPTITQLSYDVNEGWYYRELEPNEPLYALTADVNDPCDIKKLLTYCWPLAYYMTVDVNEPHALDSKHTAILSVKMNPSTTISRTAMKMKVVDVNDNKVTLISDWVVPSCKTDFQGDYFDDVNNLYKVVFTPEGTYLDLSLPENGDFNADGKTDVNDLRLFCEGWLTSDIGLEEPNNWNGIVNFKDFAFMALHWLQ